MSRGFTLIELLITVTIGGILLSAALSSYRGVGKKQSLKQAGVSLQTELKSYQQKALAGTKPEGCAGRLEGYEVGYVDTASYTVQARCTVLSPEPVSLSLLNQAEFESAFSPKEIFFPVLSSVVSGAQTITIIKDSYRFRVTVEAAGVIRGEML